MRPHGGGPKNEIRIIHSIQVRCRFVGPPRASPAGQQRSVGVNGREATGKRPDPTSIVVETLVKCQRVASCNPLDKRKIRGKILRFPRAADEAHARDPKSSRHCLRLQDPLVHSANREPPRLPELAATSRSDLHATAVESPAQARCRSTGGTVPVPVQKRHRSFLAHGTSVLFVSHLHRRDHGNAGASTKRVPGRQMTS